MGANGWLVAPSLTRRVDAILCERPRLERACERAKQTPLKKAASFGERARRGKRCQKPRARVGETRRRDAFTRRGK